jgi:hypothetical protein
MFHQCLNYNNCFQDCVQRSKQRPQHVSTNPAISQIPPCLGHVPYSPRRRDLPPDQALQPLPPDQALRDHTSLNYGEDLLEAYGSLFGSTTTSAASAAAAATAATAAAAAAAAASQQQPSSSSGGVPAMAKAQGPWPAALRIQPEQAPVPDAHRAGRPAGSWSADRAVEAALARIESRREERASRDLCEEQLVQSKRAQDGILAHLPRFVNHNSPHKEEIGTWPENDASMCSV